MAEQRLDEEMKGLEPRDQVLHINLDGLDPDSGMTLVPYVKGGVVPPEPPKKRLSGAGASTFS